MLNPLEKQVENMEVRVRCFECRMHFHARVHQILSRDGVSCPSCGNDMQFQHIGHIREHETVADYIHHVEQHTARPHFSELE